MNGEDDVKTSEALTRRQWVLRLGELVVLSGISGMVPEVAAGMLSADAKTPSLPPGLYLPSTAHMTEALSGGMAHIRPGSETDYVRPSVGPYKPLFFSAEEFQIARRLVEILLGKVDPAALAQSVEWLDLWLHSAAGVRDAAQHLDPLHRALAVGYYGEDSVKELETRDPQAIAREGLAALRKFSNEKHGHAFLELTLAQQTDLVGAATAMLPENSLQKFLDVTRGEAIRGYFTSAEGLDELDYKGNAFYPTCPGCGQNHGRNARHGEDQP